MFSYLAVYGPVSTCPQSAAVHLTRDGGCWVTNLGYNPGYNRFNLGYTGPKLCKTYQDAGYGLDGARGGAGHGLGGGVLLVVDAGGLVGVLSA